MTQKNSPPAVLPLLSTETPNIMQSTLQRLRRAMPEETIGELTEFSLEQLAGVEVAIAANPTPDMLDALPNLIWVQSLWAGVENLLAPAAERDFAVARLVDPALADSMAEAALAWTLYLHRSMPAYARQQRKHQWQQLPWRAAADTGVTVLGLGELGRACAARLQANGFSVTGWSASAKTLPGIVCYHGNEQLTDALAKADIVLVLLPLTLATNGLLHQQTLALLPKGAALINFARGPIVDTTSLLMALGSGQLRHAVLDVFDEEPLPVDNPLWDHPDITVLPHIAAPTDPASAAAIAAANIRNYRVTGVLPPTVDLARGF